MATRKPKTEKADRSKRRGAPPYSERANRLPAEPSGILSPIPARAGADVAEFPSLIPGYDNKGIALFNELTVRGPGTLPDLQQECFVRNLVLSGGKRKREAAIAAGFSAARASSEAAELLHLPHIKARYAALETAFWDHLGLAYVEAVRVTDAKDLFDAMRHICLQNLAAYIDPRTGNIDVEKLVKGDRKTGLQPAILKRYAVRETTSPKGTVKREVIVELPDVVAALGLWARMLALYGGGDVTEGTEALLPSSFRNKLQEVRDAVRRGRRAEVPAEGSE